MAGESDAWLGASRDRARGLRLYTIAMAEPARNLWDAPNILLQKFPAPEFEVTAKLSFHAMADTDKTGLISMGSDYA